IPLLGTCRVPGHEISAQDCFRCSLLPVRMGDLYWTWRCIRVGISGRPDSARYIAWYPCSGDMRAASALQSTDGSCGAVERPRPGDLRVGCLRHLVAAVLVLPLPAAVGDAVRLVYRSGARRTDEANSLDTYGFWRCGRLHRHNDPSRMGTQTLRREVC